MKKKTMVLLAALAAFVLAIPALQTKAAETGYWKLTSGPVSEKGLEEYGDATHKLTYVHDDATKTVYHLRTFSYDTQADGHIEGNFKTSFSYAPAKINGDETVQIDIASSVDNNMKNRVHANSCYVYCDSTKFYRKSDNGNDAAALSIETGPNPVHSKSETVYYKVSAGKTAGETMTILMETSQGQMSGGLLVGGITTKWNYTWTVEKTEDKPAETPVSKPAVKPDKGAIASISGAKKKVKITVKPVEGASAYQIRYKVGSSKKWKTAKMSAKNVFTIKAKKGTKISVQARVKNAAGTGAWGKTKKFKVKK